MGDREHQFVVDHSVYPIESLKGILEDGDKLFILQNAKFDLRFFYHHRVVIKNVYDTFLAEKINTNGILNIRRSLDHLVKRHCGKDVLDKDIRGQIHWRGLDETVVRYAAADVEYLEEIMESQKIKSKELGTELAVKLDNSYVRALAYTEYVGFKLNRDKWEAKCIEDDAEFEASRVALDNYIFENNLTKYIDSQLDLFDSGSKTTINWASSHQVIPLFKELGINVVVEEKGVKKESIEASVIEKQAKDFDILPLYLKYKKLEKRTSTYGRNFYKHINPVSGRLHTQFTQLMETGRLSSGGKDRATGTENLNFQNIPRDNTRSCFTPEEGNTFIVSDYSGQEQIVLANQSMDTDLLHFYSQNLGDMHSFVCSKIYPELGNDLGYIKTNYKEKRQIAKSAGFAINYGGNGFTIAANLGISMEEGQKVYDAYFKAFPGLDNYFTNAKNKAFENGYILFNNITGRKFFFDNDWFQEQKQKFTKDYWAVYRQHKEQQSEYFQTVLKPEVKAYFLQKSGIERKALNYPVQGSSADITKLASIYFFNWLDENNLLFKVLIPNVIHDKFLSCLNLVNCWELLKTEELQEYCEIF